MGKGGVIYGVKMSSDLNVQFGRAEILEKARMFQGSKYVQSVKKTIFKNVKEDLLNEKKVLYTIDIICHGVPSQKLLHRCIKEQEIKHCSKIKGMTFRDKNYGWRNQEINMVFENGKNYHSPIWKDEFYRLFTSNYILRDSCYSCHYSNIRRPGDITIGDFWNIICSN